MTSQKILLNHFLGDASPAVRDAASAIGGGMVGAFFGSTPVENIILKQQLDRCGPAKAIQNMLNQGVFRLWVGLPELAMREAGFAGVMLWGAKAARNAAYERTQNEALASGAELAVCLCGAAATQPFDTIATIKQKHDGMVSTSKVVQEIYQRHGLKGLVCGLSSRIILFSGCAVIIPRTTELVRKGLGISEQSK